MSCKRVSEVAKNGEEELLVLRQWPRREGIEFCCSSAESEWRKL